MTQEKPKRGRRPTEPDLSNITIDGPAWVPLVNGMNAALDRQALAITLCRLTAREVAVLKAITSGEMHKEICERLGIAKATVEAHAQNIRRKTGAKSIVELVHFAIANAFITVRNDLDRKPKI